MKLRNKKTGEIKSAEARGDGIYLYDETTGQWYKYELDLLAKWWEYYEEPKKHYWVIDEDGVLVCRTVGDFTNEGMCKQIGNYFEAEEEAEKAVEKLKAFKRLRDKGFSFCGYDDGYKHDFNSGHIEFYVKNSGDVLADLDICFGGEE